MKLALRSKEVAAITALLGLHSPMKAETVNMVSILPASASGAARLNRLIVRPFAGPAGYAFSRAVQTALNTSDIAGAPYFTLVAQGPRNASNADGVIDGSASANFSDQNYGQTVTTCTQYRGLKCAASSTNTIQCTTRSVSVIFDLRIARVGSNEIVYSAHKPLSSQLTWCEGQVISQNVQQMIEALTIQAAEQIRFEIAPHSQTYSVRVMEATDGISKSGVQIFRDLVRLSQANLADSCIGWMKLTLEEPRSPSLRYNLGICSERSEDYAAAASDYRQAQSLFRNGKREVAAAINRVDQLQQARLQVEQQLALRRTQGSALQAPFANGRRR